MRSNESGRTLMEMMAVLGMMGLLTMGSMVLYRNAVSKMRANDLLDEARKRALVSSRKSSKITYGIYDQKEGGASPITAYGFGVADNTTGVTRGTVDGYQVAFVPVGAINGGHAVDKATCKVLLEKIYDPDTADADPMMGAIMEIYEGDKCRKALISCGTDEDLEEGEEAVPAPEIICLAIKS